MFSSTEQFYLKDDILVFNNSATIELLDSINLKGVVTFDLRLIVNSVKTFLKSLLKIVLRMNVRGVTMYVSEELDYLYKDYENQDFEMYNSNPVVIFESPKKVDVVFFNGINKVSITEIKEKLSSYKNKNVVFNFSNLDLLSLNYFIPTFIGWITNSGLKNITFSKHTGEINTLLERGGVYCMVKVSNLISFPKKKSQKINSTQNKKINKFLRFANYGALQF